MTTAIHRLIEQQTTLRGESPALIDDLRTLTYRDLNDRANRVARFLIGHGFKRGSLAVLRMPRSCELAVILLGVLKAGGCYTWIEDNASLPPFAIAQTDEKGEQQFLALDIAHALSNDERSPNLPIHTRDTDVACALPDGNGLPVVLVPHATIIALRDIVGPRCGTWLGEPAAFDLWLPLMAGAPVFVGQAPVLSEPPDGQPVEGSEIAA
jgi:non-ribosomal peptide synthetase component F